MIQIHGFPMSPNTRRVLLGMEEIEIPYGFVPVDLMSGAHKTPSYLKLNPTGRVPVMVDGDFVLWESNAILQYIASLRPDLGLDGGNTVRGHAHVAQWLFMNAAHFSPAFAHVFAHTIRLPEEQRIPKLVENGRAEIARGLVVLDAQLATAEYLVGRLTIADLSYAATLAVAPMLGVDLTPYPAVAAWLGRLHARPAYKKVMG